MIIFPAAEIGGEPSATPQSPNPGAGLTLEGLVGLDREALDQLYAQAGPGTIPVGKVRGRVLGLAGGRLASGVARIAWQGKVFRDNRAGAVNRFFGLRMIRAEVGYGTSWRDGGSAIILDYQETSRIYTRYRDEVREVAPGLYLGLMYERTCPVPGLAMYFALEARPACDGIGARRRPNQSK